MQTEQEWEVAERLPRFAAIIAGVGAAPPKDSAEFALAALVAAGHVSQSKVDEARALMPEGGDVTQAAPEGWQLSRDEMDLCRQWFNSVQDTNGGYLIPADYTLAAKIYERLGLRIPKSISNVLEAAPKP